MTDYVLKGGNLEKLSSVSILENNLRVAGVKKIYCLEFFDALLLEWNRIFARDKNDLIQVKRQLKLLKENKYFTIKTFKIYPISIPVV